MPVRPIQHRRNGRIKIVQIKSLRLQYAEEFPIGTESRLCQFFYFYLSCNFCDLATGTPVLDAYLLQDYGGVQVAYVGVSTPETLTKSDPTHFQDDVGNYIYSFCEGGNGQDLYTAVQNAVDASRAEGADYVVALAHLGMEGRNFQ